MNIVKYIIEILKENEKVAVPGLGSFKIEYNATTIHPVEHSFTPPSKTILFDSSIPDDDMLVRTISEQENISTTEALNAIRTFSDALLSDIQKGKMAGIEGLGVFSQTAEHHIAFVPETNDFSDEEFGLTGFTSPAIARTTFKDKAVLNTQKAKDAQLKRSKRIKQYLIITAFILIVPAVIFLVTFTDVFRNFLYNNEKNSKTEQPAVINETPAPVQMATTDTAKLTNEQEQVFH